MSFAIIALWVAGAGVAGMALTAAAVGLLPLPPAGRAAVALAGIVLTVVAMGVASNHITTRAIRVEYGDEDGAPDDEDDALDDAASSAESGERRHRPDGLR